MSGRGRDVFYRAFSGGDLEVRSATTTAEGTAIRGVYVPFNTFAEIGPNSTEGHFMEQVAPHAVTDTHRQRGPAKTKLMYAHGTDPQIGGKTIGRLTAMDATAEGATFEAVVYDRAPHAAGLLPAIESGDLQVSMGFRVIRESFVSAPRPSAHNPDGIPERTLESIAVHELSLVVFPAYGSTSVGVARSVSMGDEVLFGRFVGMDSDRLQRIAYAACENGPLAGTTPAEREAFARLAEMDLDRLHAIADYWRGSEVAR